jgi:NAD/NADP transhydrogenase alpha subunit
MPHAHDGGRHDPAGQGRGPRRGRCRSAGDRDRAPPRREVEAQRHPAETSKNRSRASAASSSSSRSDAGRSEDEGGYAKESTEESLREAAGDPRRAHEGGGRWSSRRRSMPGRPAPKLVTTRCARACGRRRDRRPGGAEQGGNVELARRSARSSMHEGVKILGLQPAVACCRSDASQMFARNVLHCSS